jgi:hypothetical protein
MLSWTLRRKSAPPAVDDQAQEDLTAQEASSPSKSPRGRSKSLSSKGSLSSLFSKSKKDNYAKLVPISFAESADHSRSMDPADLVDVVDVVERDLYPVYDSSKAEHTSSPAQGGRDPSSSPRRPRSRSRRSSLRKIGSKSSLQPPRNFLESLAFKIRSATEYFHKDSSSSQSSEESHASKASSTRSLSPKKSVRFRSGTFSNESDAASSPIDVPNKVTPRQLHLKLPSGDLLRDVTNEISQDPIPTGRPQDTPLLEDKAASGYFFPFPTELDQELDKLKGHRGKLLPLPLIDLKKRVTEEENPFDDAAGLAASAQDSPVAEKPVTEPIASVPGAPDIPRGVSVEEELASISPSKPPYDSHRRQPESESNVTNPFCESIASLEEMLVPQSTPESLVPDVSMSVAPSAWTLDSRMFGMPGHVDGQDSDDSDSSASTLARLRKPRKPTHEDIRLQFRRRRSKDDHAVESSKFPDQSLMSSPQEATEVTSVPKLSSSSAGLGIVPEASVSPLALTSTVSSTTPVRTRAFRFSSTTPPGAVPKGPTRLSRDGGPLPRHVYTGINAFEDKTPSPVAVPLPLSVPPKQQTMSKWRDQHGWTPFDEPRFPEAFVSSQDIHYMLLQPGGMSQVWRILSLPRVTAPDEDTKALNENDIKGLGHFCAHLHMANVMYGTGVDDRLERRNSMSELFSPYSSDYINPFGPLSSPAISRDDFSATEDKSTSPDYLNLQRSPRQYSGEVSTMDGSVANLSTDSDNSCSLCKTQNSSCRCTATTQSSLDPGNGYDPEYQSVRAPTKRCASRVSGSIDTTPKQSDFTKRILGKVDRDSSLTTTDTNTTGSDEEQYIKGII